MDFLLFLEIIGTIAFAVSGALAAIRKNMDIFGIIMIGVITSVGGGIIRDLMLGITPPQTFQNPLYAIIAAITSIFVFFLPVRKYVESAEKYLFIMDTLGLAIFTVMGIRSGIAFDNPNLSVFVGVITGVGGGILRDLLTGETPYIFVKHFYACASIIGAIAATLLWSVSSLVAMITGAVLIIALRTLAAIYRWSLPHPKH